MLKIAVIGGGDHSRKNHLPALAAFVSRNPGAVEFAAFCDLRCEVAESVGRQYGAGRVYTGVAEMLAGERLDGCIAVTPVQATAAVAQQVITAGIPLLMEKPPGATVQEARRVCALVKRSRARVMVSVNRRFDPALTAAAAWRGSRPLEFVRATMLRHSRREPEFITDTAIHCVDALRWIAGDVRRTEVESRVVGGVRWYSVRLAFESRPCDHREHTPGASGVLEVMPTCGAKGETYELFGPDYRVLARAGESESGEWTAWENGVVARHAGPVDGAALWEVNGTYAETAEFVAALRENRPPRPSPADVLQSVELCRRIAGSAAHTAGQPARRPARRRGHGHA